MARIKKEEMIQMLCNRAMKGSKQGRYAIGTTEEYRIKFTTKYKELAEKIVTILPRANSAIGAVILKCALKYNEEKALGFATALSQEKFNGVSDPVHKLWLFLLNQKKINAVDLYAYVVTAARAWCENRTITQLRQSITDVLEWDENADPIK